MSNAKKIIQDDFSFTGGLDELELSEDMYQKFAHYMYEIAGVNLPSSPKNHALLRNRIIKILRRHSFTSYEEYWKHLKNGNDKVINEFVSALTTNMTSFYRESAHFDFLSKTAPDLFKKKQELRVWCAASSTGQEPYTIAMTICESFSELQLSRIKILATDIDNQVLAKASQGVYEERECQGLDSLHKQKYFDFMKKDGEDYYRIKDVARKLITFAPFNLVNGTYEFKQKFDIVFCRNVLIYFDEPTTKKVIDNLVSCVATGGYLILGHSESGNVKHQQIKPLSRAVYQKL